MSWYREGTTVWKWRWALTVDNTGGAAGTIDASGAIPTDWDFFWLTINQTDGRDIRVVDADGKTLLTYELAGIDVANRTLTIEVDNYAAPEGGMCTLWLYWGATGVSTASTAVVPASAKAIYVELANPNTAIRKVVCRPPPSGQTKPEGVITKASDETVFLWLDVRALLQNRLDPDTNRRFLEEIDYADYEMYSADGTTAQNAMESKTSTRIEDGWIKVRISGGTTATDYICTLTIGTTSGQILKPRVLVRVRDVNGS